MFYKHREARGFTLVELLVVIAIIGILSSIVFASFGGARQNTRDEIRQTDLKQLQLAVEMYRAQFGSYPASGCGTSSSNFTPTNCAVYITGLAPEFIPQLPRDPFNRTLSYQYRSDGTSYKIISSQVERKTVTVATGGYENEFARCPRAIGVCGATPPPNVYGVYGGPSSLGW